MTRRLIDTTDPALRDALTDALVTTAGRGLLHGSVVTVVADDVADAILAALDAAGQPVVPHERRGDWAYRVAGDALRRRLAGGLAMSNAAVVGVVVDALDKAGMLSDPDAEVRAAAVRAEAERDRYRDALAELLDAIGVGRDDHRHKYLNVTVTRAALDAARSARGAS